MTRVLIAPDSFKGTLTALEAACHIAGGLKASRPDMVVDVLPLADGGDGTQEVLGFALGGEEVSVQVQDPLGRPFRTSFLVLPGGQAVLEMARAAGLTLLEPTERDPAVTSTYGVGQLIILAASRGAREILLGSGGSATVDGGTGALRAMGFRFLDSRGRPVPEGGGGLNHLRHVEMPGDARFFHGRIRILCDVDNPLLGPTGAARVFGPQKGAGPSLVEELERGLARLARVSRPSRGAAGEGLPGMGSAGGLAFGLARFLGAELVSGAREILALTGFRERLGQADLVVTGEGRIDGQSVQGKLVGTVAETAREFGVPCAAVAGQLGEGWPAVLDAGVASVYDCFPAGSPAGPALAVRSAWALSSLGLRIAEDFFPRRFVAPGDADP